jgi:hypothetical protein
MAIEVDFLKAPQPGMTYLMRRTLARIGFAAAREFYNTKVSGEGAEIHYRPDSFSSTGAPIKSGRRMVLYGVDGKGKVLSLSSFPLNLFERGRKLRSGKKETARPVLRSFRARFQMIATGMFKKTVFDILDEVLPEGGFWADVEKTIRREVHSNGLGTGTSGSSSDGGRGGRLFGIEVEWKR